MSETDTTGLVRQNRRGDARHTRWEHKRIAEGLCVKCDAAICERSGRFCEEHRLWHNEKCKQNYERDRAKANYRSKISGHRARIRVMVMLGGLVCVGCGERDYRLLTIDHIDGHDEPIAERTKMRRGLTMSDIYRIERGELASDLFRVLCADCQILNEYRRGNRMIYPEIEVAIREAGGWVTRDLDGVSPGRKAIPSQEPVVVPGEDRPSASCAGVAVLVDPHDTGLGIAV